MESSAAPREIVDVVTVTLNPALDHTLNIEEFQVGEVNRVSEMRTTPGGKGVNVAATLADYGFSVAATGFLGSDNAVPFENLFHDKAIIDGFVRLDGATRVGIKVIDTALQNTTDINFPGLKPTEMDIEMLFSRLEAIAAPWVVIGGSIPPGTPESIYCEMICALKARGRMVALDASGPAFASGLRAGPDFVKPNIRELEELLGKKLTTIAEIDEAAQTLLEHGPKCVAVSMGAEGALFITEKKCMHARPPEVQVKSTVGAGDAMVAGYVAGQLEHHPLYDTARLATAFSVEAVMRIGPGLSPLRKVRAIREQVVVEPLRHG